METGYVRAIPLCFVSVLPLPPLSLFTFPLLPFFWNSGTKDVGDLRTNEFSAANNRSQILKISESVEGKPQIERDLEEIVPTIDFCAPF